MMVLLYILKRISHSAKVKEIKDNPAAYVLLGYNDTTNRSFVEMEATIEVVTDTKSNRYGYGRLKIKAFSVQKKIQNFVF